MLMALQGSSLFVKEPTAAEMQTLRGWGMKWERKSQTLTAPATLELLDRLATIVRLPPAAQARRQSMQSIQTAVERERNTAVPAPLTDYPVRANLFAHQVRAANMCMLTFGWAAPRGGGPVSKEDGAGHGFGFLFE